MEDIIKHNRIDATQRLINPDEDRSDFYFDNGSGYCITYKKNPVYVEVDRLILEQKVDWNIHSVGEVMLLYVNTKKIKIYNHQWRWYKFWKPMLLNYTFKYYYLNN